jgi:hypothetical protein
MSGLIRRTRQNRAFFIKDVDMRLSFDGISALAEGLVGGEVVKGDIIVCDSPTKKKRKMLQKTTTGYMIYYGRLDVKGGEFEPLADSNGQIKRISREIL